MPLAIPFDRARIGPLIKDPGLGAMGPSINGPSLVMPLVIPFDRGFWSGPSLFVGFWSC